jgi:hypothetical protein
VSQYGHGLTDIVGRIGQNKRGATPCHFAEKRVTPPLFFVSPPPNRFFPPLFPLIYHYGHGTVHLRTNLGIKKRRKKIIFATSLSALISGKGLKGENDSGRKDNLVENVHYKISPKEQRTCVSKPECTTKVAATAT